MATAESRIYAGCSDESEIQERTYEAIYAAPQLILASAVQPILSWRYRLVKRLIDIVGASAMLGVALVPSLIIGAAIALTSKGPIFYRELRVGRGGRLFKIWKFRSMSEATERESSIKIESSGGAVLHWRIHKHHRNPSITPVGDFLRRWSLDEIPQVLNVLLGDMSLVGPRPVIEAEVPMYAHLQEFYLAAAPGMSGLWQVSGRSNVSFKTRAELDAFYVQNWSLRKDMAILFRTVPAVLKRVGAR